MPSRAKLPVRLCETRLSKRKHTTLQQAVSNKRATSLPLPPPPHTHMRAKYNQHGRDILVRPEGCLSSATPRNMTRRQGLNPTFPSLHACPTVRLRAVVGRGWGPHEVFWLKWWTWLEVATQHWAAAGPGRDPSASRHCRPCQHGAFLKWGCAFVLMTR